MNKVIMEDKIIYILADENIVHYEINMINNNDIGLMKLKCIDDISGSRVIIDTQNHISINDFVKKYEPINKIEFENKIEVIVNEIEKHLLSKNKIIFDGDHIFLNLGKYINKGEMEYVLTYVPIENKCYNFQEDYNLMINNLFLFKSENVLELINSKSEERGQLLEKLIEEDVSNSCDNNKKVKKIYAYIIIFACALLYIFRNSYIMTIIVSFTSLFFIILMKLYFKYNDEQLNIDEEVSDQTYVIDNFPYLKKGLFDEKIYITLDKFEIGKDKANNYIINIPCISKKHAKIIRKKDAYYIVDLYSTNHTYVNDEKIEPNVERLLINGDKIKFGKEQYQFYFEK